MVHGRAIHKQQARHGHGCGLPAPAWLGHLSGCPWALLRELVELPGWRPGHCGNALWAAGTALRKAPRSPRAQPGGTAAGSSQAACRNALLCSQRRNVANTPSLCLHRRQPSKGQTGLRFQTLRARTPAAGHDCWARGLPWPLPSPRLRVDVSFASPHVLIVLIAAALQDPGRLREQTPSEKHPGSCLPLSEPVLRSRRDAPPLRAPSDHCRPGSGPKWALSTWQPRYCCCYYYLKESNQDPFVFWKQFYSRISRERGVLAFLPRQRPGAAAASGVARAGPCAESEAAFCSGTGKAAGKYLSDPRIPLYPSGVFSI